MLNIAISPHNIFKYIVI